MSEGGFIKSIGCIRSFHSRIQANLIQNDSSMAAYREKEVYRFNPHSKSPVISKESLLLIMYCLVSLWWEVNFG